MSANRQSRQFSRGPGFGGGHVGLPAEKAKDVNGTLNRLMGYLRPHTPRLIVILVAAVLSTVFSIVGPKILGMITTKLFEDVTQKLANVPGAHVDYEYIARIIAILAVLYVVSAAFGYVQQFVMATVAQKTVFAMRRDIDEKLSRLPLKYFDSRSHGDILSRATNDIDTVSNTLQQSANQLITSAITLLGVLVMMLAISPLMTLIVLITLPLSFLVTVKIAGRSQTYFAAQQKALGDLNGHVEEMYTGHKIVKAFGQEKKSVNEFGAINLRLYDVGWKAQFISGMIPPLMGFVNNVGYVLVCVAGGILVTGRAIEIGDVQAFIQYARQFSMPVSQIANTINVIQSAIAGAERVFELLDEEEEVADGNSARAIDAPRGEIKLEHVRFGYKPDSVLIEDMNVDVRPGQMIAIVGPTGAGKTTLVNLVMRFYEVGAGRITVDGVNIRDLKRGDLRRMFGMVLQDTWLFGGTIRDNIAYGREDATDEEVVRAARAAHADHFIRTLPDGYETILNEEASNISQGQKQLLTIARAILADPPILILDEATSSVDTRTEILIKRATANLVEGRTSFVIAHRLSTIRDADLILVMNEGSVVEQGTHEELLARRGFYAELYYSQFTGAGLEEAAV